MIDSGWRKSESWVRNEEGFSVEIKHWLCPRPESFNLRDDERGEHRWNVYAYIYPRHPHFAAFNDSNDMYQKAATDLPIHGISCFQRNINDKGEVYSIQVGGDYDHLYDSRFTHCKTPEEASTVFSDAMTLIGCLNMMNRREVGIGEFQV